MAGALKASPYGPTVGLPSLRLDMIASTIAMLTYYELCELRNGLAAANADHGDIVLETPLVWAEERLKGRHSAPQPTPGDNQDMGLAMEQVEDRPAWVPPRVEIDGEQP